MSHYIQVNNLDFHYVDWGENGPPLLLMHGGSRSCRSWDAVARMLCKDYWILALDAKGHGDSAKPKRGYAYTQRMADLEGFLDAMGLDDILAMGHSAGANTMGLHAATYPGRLRAMVIVEAVLDAVKTLPPEYYQRIHRRRREWESREALDAYLRQHRETRRWRSDVIDGVVAHEVFERPGGSVEMKCSPEVYNLEDHQHDTYNLIHMAPQIIAPALLIYAAESFIPREEIDAFGQALSRGQVQLVEDVGHNIYMEKPELVAKAAHQFFSTVSR